MADGCDILSVLTNQLAGGIMQSVDNAEYVPVQAEDRMALFAKQILKGAEDVWTKEFEKNGTTIRPAGDGAVYPRRKFGLRKRYFANGTVLLFCRPKGVHQPFVF
ncbi:MAG: hypothetical protein LBV41_01020 [Cytophagaceae bacterium]|jgi:hypothetical protein|nr:hypothetical protein [Cytophagaceae bacterium]